MRRLSLGSLQSAFIFSICLTVWLPLSVTVANLNLRASQLLLPFVAVVLLLSDRRFQVSTWSLLSLAGGVVWWLALLGWTLVNGPEFGHPLGRVVLMALNLLQGLAAYLLIVRVGDVRAPVRALLWSVTVLNVMIVAVLAAAALGVPISERWLAPEEAPLYADGQIVSGTVQRFIFGGVLTGCVSASAAVAAICLWFDPGWRNRWLLAVSGVSALLGMVIGFSRQAIVSLAVGLAVVVLFMLGRGRWLRLVRLTVLSAALIGVALVLVLATPPGRQFWSAFAGRAAQFSDPDAYRTGTAGSRADIWRNMGRDIARNPLSGQGQDAYLRYMDPWEEGAHNMPVEVMHSTGVVGFLGYLMMQSIAPLVAVGILIRHRLPERVRLPLIAVLGGYAAIVAASLTNLVYWNPIYWLLLGMMVAVVRLTDRAGTPALLETLDV